VETFNVPADLSLVQCNLETGRTHQIRVHLASVNHAVVGDSLYGGARSALKAARPMLHAARLTLIHPGTGEEMTWTAPLPADMLAVLAKCELAKPE
jgi:23S rRNA pseudouridine1911/1915/1917 synthase